MKMWAPGDLTGGHAVKTMQETDRNVFGGDVVIKRRQILVADTLLLRQPWDLEQGTHQLRASQLSPATRK